MVLASGKGILFYISSDLKTWAESGRLGTDYGAADVWETPELFRLPMAGSDETRWVLIVGMGEGAVASGSGMQYFVGQFDDQTFIGDNKASRVLWVDYGFLRGPIMDGDARRPKIVAGLDE